MCVCVYIDKYKDLPSPSLQSLSFLCWWKKDVFLQGHGFSSCSCSVTTFDCSGGWRLWGPWRPWGRLGLQWVLTILSSLRWYNICLSLWMITIICMSLHVQVLVASVNYRKSMSYGGLWKGNLQFKCHFSIQLCLWMWTWLEESYWW